MIEVIAIPYILVSYPLIRELLQEKRLNYRILFVIIGGLIGFLPVIYLNLPEIKFMKLYWASSFSLVPIFCSLINYKQFIKIEYWWSTEPNSFVEKVIGFMLIALISFLMMSITFKLL